LVVIVPESHLTMISTPLPLVPMDSDRLICVALLTLWLLFSLVDRDHEVLGRTHVVTDVHRDDRTLVGQV
jgi:hypothetical protein